MLHLAARLVSSPRALTYLGRGTFTFVRPKVSGSPVRQIYAGLKIMRGATPLYLLWHGS
jgi:hypothetical protein